MGNHTALSINLNKIALLRNSRAGDYPSVMQSAERCIALGCHGITVHPRPDMRHIRPQDVRALSTHLADQSDIEFNVEGNPFAPARGDYPGFIDLVLETRPHQCTLVPDTDSQLTSDHGFNMAQSGEMLTPIVAKLQQAGIRVSLFMDPDLSQISACAETGADRIELYTGPYAWAHQDGQHQELLLQHARAAAHAESLGLGVNAGHDLNLRNLTDYRSAVPNLLEVSIGHAFTVDCLELGIERTMQRYLSALAAR